MDHPMQHHRTLHGDFFIVGAEKTEEINFMVDMDFAFMEMFREPFEDGLVPKTMEALLREIRQYDALEQCYGYQYTGLMNHPASRFSLGGEPAKELYARYLQYYQARRAAWGYGEKQQ